jgi:glycosyltransferase involved in cell wall biosynthesis
MKIAFDHQAFTMQRYGGVSRYLTKLVGELELLDQEVNVFAGFHQNFYLSKMPTSIVSGRFIDGYIKKTGTIFNYFNHYLTQPQIVAYRPDIVHETYYSFEKPYKVNAPRVVTAHDMIHELFPESFRKNDPLSRNKKAAFQRADHIISVSHNTKMDLINLFDIAPDKITVIHLAGSTESDSVVTSPISSRPYLLFVGDRKGYKNFEFLLKGYAASDDLNRNLDLIAFGAGKFSKEEMKLIYDLGLDSFRVRQISGLDEQLKELYKSAEALVYPSIYEGFGLPPLEAMSLNCPVVSSNTSSMPEVIGDAAEFFSPKNMDELIHAIKKVVFFEERKKELIAKGKLRLQIFSWKKSAERTLELYRQLQ